jgi:hypothetical protein
MPLGGGVIMIGDVKGWPQLIVRSRRHVVLSGPGETFDHWDTFLGR